MLMNNNKLFWLNKFLRSRGLLYPDQRNLYAYHCSLEEYLELREILRDQKHHGVDYRDTYFCACLVFYCSEWYRREYCSQYNWSWDPIWKMLGFSLKQNDLAQSITKGLEFYWKRPLHFYQAGHRDFLGSVFSEGGLPFLVLREEDSRFQLLFNRLLNQSEYAQLSGLSTVQTVSMHVEKSNFPQFFSTDHSILLMASMVDKLEFLVKTYNLSNKSDPVTYLNNANPKWREDFPLPLDQETGSELLNSLLKTATSESKKRLNPKDDWSCIHYFRSSNMKIFLTRVSLPSEVTFSLGIEALTSRFELVVLEDSNVIRELGPCYGSIQDTCVRIRPRMSEFIVERKECESILNLAIRSGGMILSKQAIQASSVSFGEMPIGFSKENETWKFCGQASFSTQSDDVLLVLPKFGSISLEESDGLILMEQPCIFNLPVYQVKGKGKVKFEGEDVFKIRIGHSSAATGAIDLIGKKLSWETIPSQTFLGLPKVMYSGVSFENTISNQGQIYISGSKIEDICLQESNGIQNISFKNLQEETLLRRKVGILPSDFEIEMESGDRPGEGSIFVNSKFTILSQVRDKNIEVKTVNHPNGSELKLKSKGFPPTKIVLSVTPNLFSDPIDIILPFPNSGFLAVDKEGNDLAKNLCINDLLGSRLFLFRNVYTSNDYTIDLSFNDTGAKYRWKYKVSDKPLEISLFDIRKQLTNLLSLHDGIDQVVELKIFGGGNTKSYFIGRYQANLYFESIQSRISINYYNDKFYDVPDLQMILLSDPMRIPISISSRTSEGVATGIYDLPNAVNKDGPWLIIPQKNSSVSFRPLFVRGNIDNAGDRVSVHSLQKAAAVFDPRAETSSFNTVLDEMTSNPFHSGWQLLKQLFEHYSYLPLGTFEVWRALTKHTDALCMAMFVFEINPDFLARIESEFPIFWEFLPIDSFRLAAKHYADALISKGIDNKMVDRLLIMQLNKLEQSYPSYGQSIQSYLIGQEIYKESNLPLAQLLPAWNKWYQDLIRARCNDDWPEFGGKILENWARNCIRTEFSSRDYGFRRAVVFLPMFAAAVANGYVKSNDFFGNHSDAIFFLREVRDFDSEWFNVSFQCFLLHNAVNNENIEIV